MIHNLRRPKEDLRGAGLTDVHEGVTWHGVAGEGQLPAGGVREAAGEGVLTVANGTCLELRQQHTCERRQETERLDVKEASESSAHLHQVVLLQERLDDLTGPLPRRLCAVLQGSVRDEAETQNGRTAARDSLDLKHASEGLQTSAYLTELHTNNLTTFDLGPALRSWPRLCASTYLMCLRISSQ